MRYDGKVPSVVLFGGPGLALELGQTLPLVLREFQPPVITSIALDPVAMTTTVMGNAGLCEACRIDLYLDNIDDSPTAKQEALAWLGSFEVNVPPGGNTDFTVVIEQLLPEGFGIRTNATTLFPAIIGTFGTGTSTKLSDDLYTP